MSAMKRVIIIALCALISIPAHSETWDKSSAVGPGTKTCADWLKNLHEGGTQRELDKAWLFGFINAVAFVHGPNGFEPGKVDETKLLNDMDDLCTHWSILSLPEAADSIASKRGFVPPPPY